MTKSFKIITLKAASYLFFFFFFKPFRNPNLPQNYSSMTFTGPGRLDEQIGFTSTLHFTTRTGV